MTPAQREALHAAIEILESAEAETALQSRYAQDAEFAQMMHSVSVKYRDTAAGLRSLLEDGTQAPG
jgi:hypothetical protein